MGRFSSKKVHHVDTVVMRVIEDDKVPSALQTGMARSLTQGADLVPSVRLALANGAHRKFDRYFKYAESGAYFFGLPNGSFHRNTDGDAQAKAAIEADVGEPIELTYVHFRPPNNVHLARQHLHENMGWDPATNKIASLSQAKGSPVFLGSLVSSRQTDPNDPPELGSRGYMGFGPESGQTPDAPLAGIETLGYWMTAHNEQEGPELTEGCHIHYVWEDSTGTLQNESIFLDLSAWDQDEEYFQAGYKYSGGYAFWTYHPGDGIYPTLDEVFALAYTEPGTYFPFAIFRRGSSNRTRPEAHGSWQYESTKELLALLDMDFQEMGDAIHENPDINDIQQAVMMMAVPANSQNPAELAYLMRFFRDLHLRTTIHNASLPPVATHTVSLLSQSWTMARPNYAFTLYDADFNITLSYLDIKQSIRPGTVGPVGTITNTTESVQVQDDIYHQGSHKLNTQVTRYYRRQIADGIYEEVAIVNLALRYNIFKGAGVIGRAEDDHLLIPIDRNIAHGMSLHHRGELYYRSLHMVFNARVSEKVEWYQTSAFRFILTAVAIVITVVSLGAAWQTIALATSLSAAAIVVLTMVLEQLIFYYVAQLAVQHLGPDLALIAAAAAAIYGGARAFQAGGIGQSTWAQHLLTVSNSLTGAVDAHLAHLFKDYQGDVAEFELLVDERTAELEAAQELLGNRDAFNPFREAALHPLTIFGESPEDYYNRTVHAGNVGVLGVENVQHFVSESLRLPRMHEILGDDFNALV